MSDTVIIIIVVAAVLVAILVILAFSRKWIKSFKFTQGETSVSADAPDIPHSAQPSIEIEKSDVIDSGIKNRQGSFRSKRSNIDGSEIENG